MLSVRELARAQGIPDWVYIYALPDERYGVITRAGVIEVRSSEDRLHPTADPVRQMHRQIGNAVPLPLATAIGRALLDAEFEAWFALPEHERLSALGFMD